MTSGGVAPPASLMAFPRSGVILVKARRRLASRDAEHTIPSSLAGREVVAGNIPSSSGSVAVAAAQLVQFDEVAGGNRLPWDGEQHDRDMLTSNEVVHSAFYPEADGWHYSDVHELYSSMNMKFMNTLSAGRASSHSFLAYDLLIRMILQHGLDGIFNQADYDTTSDSRLLQNVLDTGFQDVLICDRHLDAQRTWRWLLTAATHCAKGLRLGVGFSGKFDSTPYLSHAQTLAGAASWLCSQHLRHLLQPCQPPGLLAGDWPINDIFTKWPQAIAVELASFSWPLMTEAEVRRFLGCSNAAPKALVGCEFTGALRTAYEVHHAFTRTCLSCDQRLSLIPGVHTTVDLRRVGPLQVWDDGWFCPPCTHHVRSGRQHLAAKLSDGRAFRTMLFVILCHCFPVKRRTVEQPDTLLTDLYYTPSQIVRPQQFGDRDDKGFYLHFDGHCHLTRDATLGEGAELESTAEAGLSDPSWKLLVGHRRKRDFADADARDRWRSSLTRFPYFCAAMVEAHTRPLPTTEAPVTERDFVAEATKLAWACYQRGIPVPYDFANADAQPTLLADRRYQEQRGGGDGRRVRETIPPQPQQWSGRAWNSTSGKPQGLEHMLPWPCLSARFLLEKLDGGSGTGAAASRRQPHANLHSLEAWEELMALHVCSSDAHRRHGMVGRPSFCH